MKKYYSRHGGIYRSRNGVFLGVCQGIAEHFDFTVFWIRMAMVIAFILTGFWPVIGIYLVAAFFLKPKPVRPIKSDEEHEFYDSYVHSPRNAAQRLRKKFSNLEKRIRRMEDKVTGKEYEWEKKFNS
jgi:phage shock protein C